MAITVHHEDNKSYFGDDDHLSLATKKSFSELIFRALSDSTPSPEHLKVFELILNLSIDHGPDAPSAKATIEEAEKGESISKAVAEGIEEINDTHGGAIEPCMKILYTLQESGADPAILVKQMLSSELKIPGFGHRLYKESDPRAQLIIKTALGLGFDSEYFDLLTNLEIALQELSGKQLPINIDGAIAGVLCSFGWDAKISKAVFIVARIPGLCAHYLNTTP